MGKLIEIDVTDTLVDMSKYLSADEMKGGVIRLYVTKTSRAKKGEKKVRMFEGTPCDDSAASNPDADHKVVLGSKLEYHGEEVSVTKVRRSWIEIEGSFGKIWTRKGNTTIAVASEELIEA